MSEHLLFERKDRVAWLTLNRPERRNALSQAMIEALAECLDSIEADPQVRVVCLTGAGDKAFCAGADLGAEMLMASGLEPTAPRLYAALLQRINSFPKPVVARVAAPCLAGGLGLMMACDIVIASQSAYFMTPEVNVGIFPYMVGALLAANLPWKVAVDMALTGRKVEAAEALRVGLVSRVTPPDVLDQEVNATLAALATKSPLGLKMGKEAFQAMREMPLDQGLDHLCGALLQALRTEDAKEGMTAFLQKRAPQFTGK